MKQLLKIQTILLLAVAALWSCDDDKTVTDIAPVAPVVSFPVAETEIGVVVDDAVHFEAVVESPGPIRCNWYVDDALKASTPTMTYLFREVGTYTVRFEAFNDAGRVERSYTVMAAGVPLVVGFSNEEETIGCMPGDEVQIEATVVSGDKQVRHAWKVGDEVVSTTAAFKHLFDRMGTFTVSYEGVNADGMRAARSWTVEVDELPLEIEFSLTDETIRCEQGAEVAIDATVKNGATGLTHKWTIDGGEVSAEAGFRHLFVEAGTFVVAYQGENGKGERVTRSWTVEVAELPLEIDFSVADAGITCKQDVEVVIVATVKNGGSTGVTHTWTLDGEVLSTTAEFRHAFAEIGTYTIAYKGVNGRQESATRNWTVDVTDKHAGYMFENFETRDALPGHFINGNPGIEGATVKENPYKTDVNPSNKVLRDLLLNESGTSGYFDMGFGHLTNRAKYRAVRVKIYLGQNLYYPRLKIASLAGAPNKLPSSINGKPFNGNNASEADWKALVKTDDWNVFVYDLIDCGFGAANFEHITSVQFRPLSTFTGQNCSGRDEVTNNRTVYYDDIEFLE